MYVYLSKVGGFLILPSNFLVVLMALGLVLSLTSKWRRSGRFLTFAGFLGLVVCAFSPAANWLIVPLEDRFQRPGTLENYDGIIVLGGAVDTVVTGVRGDTALTMSAERITITARLAKALPGGSLAGRRCTRTGRPGSTDPRR